MAVQGREIKNRLRSIKNSKKITKAMEMVSAAKMRRAVQAALNTRAYANLLWGLINRVMSQVELNPSDPVRRFFVAPQLPAGQPEHITAIVLTSNRGLCGAFNSNVIKRAIKLVKRHGRSQVELIAIGKKGVNTFNTIGIKAELAYAKDDTAKDTGSISEIAAHVYQQFKAGKTDRVLVLYTDYHSAVLQVPVTKQLFPLLQAGSIAEAVENVTDVAHSATVEPTGTEYLYEPGKIDVLDYVVPRLAEVQIYQALLESNASEHSARMLAMKNATDAAGDMIDELVLAFNRARQAVITKEIAEISAGTAAVS
ncbi:MAG: ATP synthase F1 subunit gamma [Candidatus Kerfeldbacteria bacterium]|nr:ATP synthase F1 subunit gamma [Candidatus Kerfeldbacteria bacterium]